LSANGLPGEKETAAFHGRNFAVGTNRRTMNVQRTANSVLTACLSRGGRFNHTPGPHSVSGGSCPIGISRLEGHLTCSFLSGTTCRTGHRKCSSSIRSSMEESTRE
jgi:hypothetical protein